jgi:hypothetical protein
MSAPAFTPGPWVADDGDRGHKFWGAGEPDCPREIKASNGELWKLRCKACGLDNPRDDFCRAASADHESATRKGDAQ